MGFVGSQDDMPIFTEYMGLLLQMYLDPLISSRMDQVSTLNTIREAEQSARNIEDSGAQSQHSICNLSKPSSLPRAFLLLATAVPVRAQNHEQPCGRVLYKI